ncbi:unnamed protein product [Anisakis simplex]|uniref:Col_cuticle_N domain-containing protein n=1 Tax=Anisakis simplex TaxID=6269 RepID=A0A0M3JPG4_ANISI|nr:unnamed protein product [Anisakis simplex]
MSLKGLTIGAIIFSSVTLLACLFAVWSISKDVDDIWAEIDSEMSSFKVVLYRLVLVSPKQIFHFV